MAKINEMIVFAAVAASLDVSRINATKERLIAVDIRIILDEDDIKIKIVSRE